MHDCVRHSVSVEEDGDATNGRVHSQHSIEAGKGLTDSIGRAGITLDIDTSPSASNEHVRLFMDHEVTISKHRYDITESLCLIEIIRGDQDGGAE
jgi:hypothetical protein